jgi:hypothetical protein
MIQICGILSGPDGAVLAKREGVEPLANWVGRDYIYHQNHRLQAGLREAQVNRVIQHGGVS